MEHRGVDEKRSKSLLQAIFSSAYTHRGAGPSTNKARENKIKYPGNDVYDKAFQSLVPIFPAIYPSDGHDESLEWS